MVRLWSAFAGVSMLLLLGVYVTVAARLAVIDPAGAMAVLNVSGSAPAVPEFDVSPADARRAVISDPINQQRLNTAMLSMTRIRAGSPDQDWFTTLAKLGWRDTPSLQNLTIRHALQGKLSSVLDDVDALLRRNQAIEQVTPILLAAENDPAWQNQVVWRLRRHPPWRFGYLQRGSLIDDPVLLAARARTVQALQRSGDDVTIAEITPMLPKLITAGLAAQAFEIWKLREPTIARPVADPGFAVLAADREPLTVPFHWQLTTGPDFSVDAVSRPVSYLSVSWNGSGAPVFATQHISTSAGRYAVVLTSPDAASRTRAMVGVRLVCGSEVIDFVRTQERAPTRISYTGDRAVPCDFPRLELFGRTGDGLRDRQATISRVEVKAAI